MRGKKEKEFLLKAIDSFGKRLIVITPDFKILAAGEALDDINPSQIVGKICYEVFHDRQSPCENCAVKKSIEKGKPYLRPKPSDHVSRDKMPCYYAYPLFSKKGIEGYVSMDFDLPISGGLEDQLQRTNAFLRNLILSSIDGVIAADKEGKIIIFNSVAEEISGYTRDEALDGLNIRDIYPDGLPYQIMNRLRSDEHGGKGKLRSYHVKVVNKDGKTIPIRLNAAVIYEEENEIATIGFFHDLREEQKIKTELEKAQLQLLQSEKMASLGRLAAGVAHQLNNPLSGIILFAKLIMEEHELEPEVINDLDRILKDAERCRDTVKELLEFSRQTRHNMRPHNINEAISRTMFLLEGQTLFHNIKIENKLSHTLPMANVDIQQLNHVFMNIILNAAQAMEGKGKLTLRTFLLKKEKKICVEISDTGPGIPEEYRSRIFEPFFTTKEEKEGTGLGLSLAYSIIKSHGGRILVKSNSDTGTTFLIEIPVENRKNEGDESEEQP